MNPIAEVFLHLCSGKNYNTIKRMKTHACLCRICTFLLLTGVLIFCACQDDDIPVVPPTPEEAPTESPEAWHDKIRTQPYPKENNELYINPSPLIVPESMHGKDSTLQFCLSSHESFPEGGSTLLSDTVRWSHYNPHRVLRTGTWYWRFRNVASNGNAGKWSRTYSFEVKDETPTFVTPVFSKFYERLPHSYPRLYCFLDKDKEAAANSLTKHREYKNMIGRANTALKHDYAAYANPYDFNSTEVIKPHVNYLYQKAYLTDDTQCKEKLADVTRVMLAHLPITDKALFATNFGATNIAIIFAETYDMSRTLLTADERQQAEELLLRIARHYYRMYCGMQENRFFDNHFWQHNMRILMQIALLFYDHPVYGSECSQMLEFYYELWTARAPNSGFNRSGHWINGIGYFTANVKTLWYMPLLFGTLTNSNFLAHPWYRNAGQALTYAWAPNSYCSGFGDGSEGAHGPDRQRVAFADFLARETNDGYAAWYAKQCDGTLITETELRMYRMISPKSYNGAELPAYSPKLLWHKDVGEVTIHSHIDDINNNLSLAFRSSTFGSNSHCLADHNSFRLNYRGVDVFRNGGHFVGAVNQPYNLLCYCHTRAHNTILVNGIGQPFSLKGYGQVLRAMGGDNMAYCLGDASTAYCDTTTEKAWLGTLAGAGISQTPEYGFGKTPLTKYRRHILVIYPHTVLIYDDLEASEPVRWDWLLHSSRKYTINQEENMMSTQCEEKNFHTVVNQFSDQESRIEQTTRTMVPVTPEPDPRYPDLWHLTSTFESCAQNRILTVIQICTDGNPQKAITRDGDYFRYGNYTIKAVLDSSRPAELTVESSTGKAKFSYSAENPTLDEGTYLRQNPYSSLLYDIANGKWGVTEQTDYRPTMTRTASRTSYP